VIQEAGHSGAARAIIGVVENGNSAVLVTVAGGCVLDRRTIELTPPGTPTHPHHHQGSWAVGRYLSTPGAKRISLADAVALVERVRALAEQGARDSLEAVAGVVAAPVAGIALRQCPELPTTIEACIADNRAQTYADTVMYRRVLASAAEARGWSVHWYDRERALRGKVAEQLRQMGRTLGPPWQAKHKLAAAAAIWAALENHAGAQR
jgi:hypothetical protein